MNLTELSMVTLSNPAARPRRLLPALAAATLLGAYAAPALSADYLFVSFSRQKIPNGSRECPQFKLEMKDVGSEQEAKALKREALRQEDRTDIRAEYYPRKRAVVVYKYTGILMSHPKCEITRYGLGEGRTHDDAKKRMMANAEEYKKWYRGLPSPVRIWPD
jgi:hypothetical protein